MALAQGVGEGARREVNNEGLEFSSVHATNDDDDDDDDDDDEGR